MPPCKDLCRDASSAPAANSQPAAALSFNGAQPAVTSDSSASAATTTAPTQPLFSPRPFSIFRHLPRGDTKPSPVTDEPSAFTPYTPLVPLHATLIPVAGSNSNPVTPETSRPDSTSGLSHPAIGFIVSATVLGAAVALALSLMLRNRCKNRRQGKGGSLPGDRKKRKKSKGLGIGPGDVSDLNIGGNDEEVDETNKDDPQTDESKTFKPRTDRQQDKEDASLHDDAWLPEIYRNSVMYITALDTIPEVFEERLQVEEADIALALNIALRRQSTTEQDLGIVEEMQIASEVPGHIDAKVERLADYEHNRTVNRPRQDSNATATSDASASDDHYWSDSSSLSSMTSSGSTQLGDMDQPISAFEVRRAQTKSVEMKKGVLLTWNREVVTEVPTVMISAPSPPVDQLAILSTQSTLCTEMDHYSDSADEFQTSLPHLMVTQPSSNSLLSLGSSTSSISVDLDDFPTPPPLPVTCLEKQYQHFFEETGSIGNISDIAGVESIRGEGSAVHDMTRPALPAFSPAAKKSGNAEIDFKTIARRRSTVEKFIGMYAYVRYE